MALRLKHVVKKAAPGLVARIHARRHAPFRHGTMQERFQRMIDGYVCDGLESLSGAGSSLVETRAIRRALPAMVERLGIRTLLDAPCGDFHWMSQVELGIETYYGVDVLPGLVAANRERHGAPGRTFLQLDLTVDALPRADLAICRDCLVHLSYEDAFRVLANLKRSGASYLLATTFPSLESNHDIYSGEWRRLNLERPPFSFPPPVELVNEACSVERFQDKSLGLWRLEDLPAGPGAATLIP